MTRWAVHVYEMGDRGRHYIACLLFDDERRARDYARWQKGEDDEVMTWAEVRVAEPRDREFA